MAYLDLSDRMAWLSQANHIFHRLQLTSNYEDYRECQSNACIHFH
jgi:hypothetical protein